MAQSVEQIHHFSGQGWRSVGGGTVGGGGIKKGH